MNSRIIPIGFKKQPKTSSVILHTNSMHKGGFFSENAIRFSDLQISKENIPKNYPELEI